MDKDNIKINYDKIQDAIQYFEEFRMEELKSDDVYYIKHLIQYIKYLEFKISVKDEALNGLTGHIKEHYFDKDGNAKRIYTKS